MWTEKYRPKTFGEIFGQKELVDRLKAVVEQKNLPHLLFAGPAGTGKSTLSLVIARELFLNSWKENFLELNASDTRGIDVVRGVIKDFARTKSLSEVPFKIIFLDESDSLTKDAQQALRRTMETYASTTRFILGCNYSSKIIDPIISRCAVFRFKQLRREDIFALINKIAKTEKISINNSTLEVLYELSRGDARRAINVLQSSAAVSKELTTDLLYDLVSAATPQEIRSILDTAVSGDFISARNKLLDTMLKRGLSGLDVIRQIQKEIWNLNIDNPKKIKLIDKCGEIEFRMIEGADEFIQLEALLSNFI